MTHQPLRSLARLAEKGRRQTLPRLYQLPSTDFRSITAVLPFPLAEGDPRSTDISGNHNLLTGLGRPVANLPVPDLASASPDDWYGWRNDYKEISLQGDNPFTIVYQSASKPVVTMAQAQALTCSCLAAHAAAAYP